MKLTRSLYPGPSGDRQLLTGQRVNLSFEMRESEFPSMGPSSGLHLARDGGARYGFARNSTTLVRTHNDGCDRVLTRQMKGSYLTDEDLEGSPVGKTLT